MNDLFSSSFGRSKDDASNDIEMGEMRVSLDKFFKDIDGIKDELREVESLHKKLQASHEESKTLHSANAVKDLRARMDSDIALTVKKAKGIKASLEAIDRENAANRKLPGSGPGTSSDRTRTSIVHSLKKKLIESMENFNRLRQQIGSEYKETIERRYFTVTGEKADDQTIETLIASGEGETFMQRVIQEQGRGQVMDTISEIQERHSAAKEIERSLQELHQVFLDISVLVQVQGEYLDDIESQVGRASSFVQSGNTQLQVAKKHQRSSRKWTCYAIILLLIIILIIVLPIVLRR